MNDNILNFLGGIGVMLAAMLAAGFAVPWMMHAMNVYCKWTEEKIAEWKRKTVPADTPYERAAVAWRCSGDSGKTWSKWLTDWREHDHTALCGGTIQYAYPGPIL